MVDYIIIGILLILVIVVLLFMRRRKKEGKGCCGCSSDCSKCNKY